MFDNLFEEIYKNFKAKMNVGAYIEPEGNIYIYSKDEYNNFLNPMFNRIKQGTLTEKLNEQQKKIYNLYFKTHQKFVQSRELLFFTVYKIKSADLDFFVNEYERLSREQKRILEERKREDQKKLEEQVKKREMILDFKGIEKIRDISIIYNGGSLYQLEWKIHKMPLSVYLYLENPNDDRLDARSLPYFGMDSEFEFDNATPNEIKNYNFDSMYQGEFDDNDILDIINLDFEDFKLKDIVIDFIDEISEEEQDEIKLNAFETIKNINKKFPLLKQVKYINLDSNYQEQTNNKISVYSDNALFERYRLFSEIKKRFNEDDLNTVYLLWFPHVLIFHPNEETNISLNIFDPKENKNLKDYFDNNPLEFSYFSRDKVLLNEQKNYILEYYVEDVDDFDYYLNETTAYAYIPLENKFHEIESLEEKYKKFISAKNQKKQLDKNPESINKKSFNRTEKVVEVEPSTRIKKSLENKNIVITGTLKHFTRNTIKTTIQELGGKVQSDINDKTSFLLAGFENLGSKYDKAKSRNIEILNEDKFLELITNKKVLDTSQEVNERIDDNSKNLQIEKTSNDLSVEERLKILKKLYDSGLVSEEEYSLKKKTIIDDI